jgi:hypothetical protein
MSEFVSIVQAITTIVLVFITWQYVKLTKQLVHLQIDPKVDFDIPHNALENTNKSPVVVNNSGCEIENITLSVAALYLDSNGELSRVMRCLDNIDWKEKLKPKKSVKFNIDKYFNIVNQLKSEGDIPQNIELAKDLVSLSLSYSRAADGKIFCFKEVYRAVLQDDQTVTICKAGPRQYIDSLEATILKRTKD